MPSLDPDALQRLDEKLRQLACQDRALHDASARQACAPVCQVLEIASFRRRRPPRV